MKKTLLSLFSLTLTMCLAAPTRAQNDNSKTPTLLVDDDKVQCPTASFTSIQAAVNAAQPGDMIRVCPGTYPEQVTIEKPLSILGDNGAVVIPSNVTPNASDPSTAESIAAVIVVRNTNDVAIEGLIVDGSNNDITECGPDFIGILFQNASGRVAHNAVRHIRLAPSLPGCQSGNAILVQSSSGGESDVEIHQNSVSDYQKNGITGDEPGTEMTVTGNVVTGIGPNASIAQNGIQAGFGAKGSIVGNSVAGNVYSPCASVQQCEANGTGILVYQSDEVQVTDNSVGTNQVGIFIGGNDSRVRDNTVFNSQVLIGVAIAGDKNDVTRNEITHSDDTGVLIQGNNNQVERNRITDAAVGILKITGSVGNTLAGNRFFATLVPVEDPAAGKPIAVKPVR